MVGTKLNKLIAFILAVLIITGTAAAVVPVVAADAADSNTSKNEETTEKKTLAEISEALNAISYVKYRAQHKDAVRATKEVIIEAVNYDAEKTTAKVDVYKDYEGMEGDALYISDSGTVVWPINVPETGLYAIEIQYYPVGSTTNSIERMFYINGKVPFAEARYLAMTKVWKNLYPVDDEGNYTFNVDINGNDIRPVAEIDPEWRTYSFIDANGYYSNPFEFYFEEGENTIALECVREPVVIKYIRLYPYQDLPTYAEVEAEYVKAGYKEADAEPIKIRAEITTNTSHETIYPIYDRTSAITVPQHPTHIKLNTIGSNKWQNAGYWIRYEFDVEKEGLYQIAVRFKQSELNGIYVSRRLRVDGKVPFEEANALRFDYSTDWQSKALGDDDGGGIGYQFYFTPGTHTIELEVSLGELGTIVGQVSETLDVINNAYLHILKLTGTNPDKYRDYGFSRVMPDTIRSLVREGNNLERVIEQLKSMNGVTGSNTASLLQIQRLVEKMGSDEDEIAKNLSLLKSNIGTLGTWINTVTKQPLEIDTIYIQPASAPLPKAEAGFFQSLWYEIRQFIGSFFTDYNSLGSTVEVDRTNSVDVWVTTGRDQAQIIRNLIDNKFSPKSGIAVNLKLVAGGTLLPSVLAGVGPDVSLFMGDGDVINYAIRGALKKLNDFDTFDEVLARFSPAATIPLTLYGETYAIPETQTFPMLFYRKDILADLGLEVPKTWEDLLAMIPVLQYNKMDIGLTTDYLTYLYQMGGELYADNGMRVNLDSNTALEAFEMMCNMFTMYSLPYTYDFANRFRTGEIPIAISPYTSYNQLVIFATEIAGLWDFTTIPGMLQDDGTINNTAVSTVAGVVMLTGTDNPEGAWRFIDWYTDEEFQADYCNELVALLGEAGMNPTANIAALEELPWSSFEYKSLRAQFDALTAVPNYPGSYIIGRYTNFAFLSAYNEKASPSEALLGYINAINKEISRKREEFNLETLEIGQTLAEKRADQALAILNKLKGDEASKYADKVSAAKAAIDAALSGDATTEQFDALIAAADELVKANSELFGEAAGYMKESATALYSYIE
jgi:ABC-type glycerol-3-phosphate transport system substrate-binding protein